MGKEKSESEQSLSWCGVITRTVLRHRLLFTLVSVAFTVALGTAAATRLSLQAGIEHMIDDAAKPDLAVEEASFAVQSEIAVIVRGPVYSESFLTRLRDFQYDLETLPMPAATSDQAPDLMFTQARSMLDVRQVTNEDDILEFLKLGDLLQRGLSQFERAARGDPNVVGKFVDRAGKHAVILLSTRDLSDPEAVAVNSALNEVAAKHRRAGFEIQTVGLPVLKAFASSLIYEDGSRLTLLAIAMALAILILTFRHPIGVIGPGLVIGQTLATMFGVMALLDVPLTVVGLYLPGLVAVISIMDAIHIQSTYSTLCRGQRPKHAAIIEAASIAGSPMLYTAGTTCLGLLSLRVARLEAVRDLGTFGALGVAAAVVHTLITIPLVLSLHRGRSFGRSERGDPDWLDRALVPAERLCHGARFGRTRVLIGLAIVALTVTGISRVEVRHDVLEWLPNGNPLSKAVATLDEHLGGSASMTVLVDFGRQNALEEPETLARLARVEAAVRAYRDPENGQQVVREVSSVLELVRGVWRATRDPGLSSELPADPRRAEGVFDFLQLLGPRELSEFATLDGQRTRLNIRRTWTEAVASNHLIEYVRAALRHELGPGVKLATVGPMVLMHSASTSVLHDLVNSFSVGILTIALVFIAFLRSIRLGVLAIIPNTLPVAMTLGLMGFLDYPLDLHAVLLASVVLGIVDDDTFHFMHHFRTHHALTGDTEASLRRAFTRTGRALVISSCTLAFGFLTYLGASMHQLQRTAILISFAVVSATACELMLSPALLRRFVPSRATGEVKDTDFKEDQAVAN